jgi:hypothetical protein
MAYLTYFDHTCMLMYLVSEKCPYAKTPKLSIFIINLLYIPIKLYMQLYIYIYIYISSWMHRPRSTCQEFAYSLSQKLLALENSIALACISKRGKQSHTSIQPGCELVVYVISFVDNGHNYKEAKETKSFFF